MIKENQRLLNQLNVVCDGLVVFCSMLLAYWIRFYVFTGIEGIPFAYYLTLAAVAVGVVAAIWPARRAAQTSPLRAVE